MATYVLIAGAWLGGWAWQRVTPYLRAAGHEVYTPTLTGLGDRVHLGQPETGLETHIQDIVNLIEFEGLDDIVLLGHSYAGFPVTGAASRIPDKIRRLVYMGNLPPLPNQAMFDFFSEEGRKEIEAEVRESDDGFRFSNWEDISPQATGISEEDSAWFWSKQVGQPVKTLSEPLVLPSDEWRQIPQSYIVCTEEEYVLRPETLSAGWTMHDLPTGHWPMASMPEELAQVLDEIGRL